MHRNGCVLMVNKLEENQSLNLKEFREQRIFLRSLPTRAWLSLTSRCNLKCAHCARGTVRNQYLHPYDMERDLFRKIENDLFSTLKLCRIGGNNLGEQLCYKMWDELFEGFLLAKRLEFIGTVGREISIEFNF